MLDITTEQKELSRVTKEEWREYTKTVWHIANVADGEHPAVFPREIPRRLIKLFSLHGEQVLDPFAGVGTTACVALELSAGSMVRSRASPSSGDNFGVTFSGGRSGA